MAGFVLEDSSVVVWPDQEAAVPVTERGLAERRILQRSMWYGLAAQPASLVRDSSRRSTIVRLRPADIRVINRRICLSSCHPLCRLPAWLGFHRKNIQPGAS